MHIGNEVGALQLAHDGQRGEHRPRPTRQHHRRQPEHLAAVGGAVGTAFATRQHDEAACTRAGTVSYSVDLAVAKPQRRQQRMIGSERAVGGDVHEVEPGEHRPHVTATALLAAPICDVRVQRLDRRPLDACGGDAGADDQADERAGARRARSACNHSWALGDSVTERPARLGRPDHGIACSPPTGTSTSGASGGRSERCQQQLVEQRRSHASRPDTRRVRLLGGAVEPDDDPVARLQHLGSAEPTSTSRDRPVVEDDRPHLIAADHPLDERAPGQARAQLATEVDARRRWSAAGACAAAPSRCAGHGRGCPRRRRARSRPAPSWIAISIAKPLRSLPSRIAADRSLERSALRRRCRRARSRSRPAGIERRLDVILEVTSRSLRRTTRRAQGRAAR